MKKNNNHGLTLIGLILLILIFVVVVGVIIVASISKEKEFEQELEQQVNEARVYSIESDATEDANLACSSICIAIAQALSQNRNYSAIENAEIIQKSMLESIKSYTYLAKEGWAIEDYATNGDTTFTIVYQGENYKNATKNPNAKIVITFKLTINSIAVQE